MVNIKSTLAFGLLAITASAASIHNDKRHVHHRRHNKRPCSTGPYAVGNSTVPAGTGVKHTPSTAADATSTPSVVTVSVIPVPVSPAPSSVAAQASSQPAAASPSASSPAAGASAPAGSQCGAATTYVTVQQTITVTAGQIPKSTSSSTTPVVVASPSKSTTPVVIVASSSKSSAPAASAIIETPVPISTTPAAASAPAMLQTGKTSASPAPSTTPVASSPVSGGKYSGKKMGTSWDPNQTWLFSALGINIGASWVYDWGQEAHGVPSGVEYVPTLHDKDKCADFAGKVESQSGVQYLKHFNEPDMTGGGGSGLSVGEAASLHKQYIAPLGSKYQLGFPAVTSNNIPGSSGTGWLEAFVNQVGCGDFSFADFHFYGAHEATEQQAEIFLGYVDNWIETVDRLCPGKNLPIWITEFSAGPTPGDAAQAAAFMAVAGPKLESNPRVARYAYFFPSNNEIANALGGIVSALHGA